MVNLIQDYFTSSATRYPNKIAVACRNEKVTFKALEESSNVLARSLKRAGVLRGTFVPIFIPKSINSIRAILAVLKADCAYVPLDVGSPPGRLASILAATKSKHVLVDNSSRKKIEDLLDGTLTNTVLINIDDQLGDSSDPLCYANISIDIAYVLFTSGSTGIPKGVMISHQMITDYIDWCVDTYSLNELDVIANHAPLYFDNSTFDLYTAFKTGAQLELVHDELNLIMHKLINWIEERGITTFFCVPSVMTILLRSGRLVKGRLPALRHVIAAGEVLPPDILRGWMRAIPHARFTNMYGPTEITVDCTFYSIDSVPPEDTVSIPIGRPRQNMEVFIRLDDGSLSSEPGSEGEIAVRGRSVAYGYLNNPEKTRAAFIQNPRHDLFHDPIYLTGDLARIDCNGNFLYVGRKDHQIKYMGNRIELGEIEAALMKVKGVLEGVIVFNDAAAVQDKCIGALVRLAPGTDVNLVRVELKRMLPDYMVPRRIVIADEMPRTPNGKSDRLAAFDLVFQVGAGLP